MEYYEHMLRIYHTRRDCQVTCVTLGPFSHPECGTHLFPGASWKLSETPCRIRKPPCCLGEDNEYVYKSPLGVSDEEYAELQREGYIGMDYDPSITVFGRAKNNPAASS